VHARHAQPSLTRAQVGAALRECFSVDGELCAAPVRALAPTLGPSPYPSPHPQS
jgi:hypothetical protein